MPVSRAHFLVLSAVKAALAAGMILFLGWIGVALTVTWIIIEGIRFRRCHQCGGHSLIPVGTPVGMRIMEEEGWHGQA
jgi:hypothetical protein